MRNLLVTLVAVLFPFSLLFSQTGKIAGRVIDRETGDAVAGATIVIVGTTRDALTDASGEFLFLSVAPGVYSVRPSSPDCFGFQLDGIQVNSDLTTELRIEFPCINLDIFSGGTDIVADRPLVHKNATNAIRIQSYDDMKNLPVRGVTEAVVLQPGVVRHNGQIYMRGGRENDVGYYLEGANVRDRDGGSQFGSNPVSVIPEALEALQVQPGGYAAEFGGANAGMVRQTLKVGGPKFGFSLQYETDDFADQGEQFLGTYSYGYHDFTATASGPVPGTGGRLRFFAAGERLTLDDYVQRFNSGFNFTHVDEAEFNALGTDEQLASIQAGRFPLILEYNRDPGMEAHIQKLGLSFPDGNVPGADRQEWIGNGTLTLDASPFRLRLGGSIRWRRQDEVIGRIPRMIFNLDRQEQQERSSALINLKATHLLSSKSFYELNLNYFDLREHHFDPIMGDNFWAYWDSTANASHGIQFYDWDSPWLAGGQTMELHGFDFDAPGTPAQSDMVKRKRSYFGGNLNFVTQLSRHELKLGASLERWTSRNFQFNSWDALALFRSARSDHDFLRRALAGDRSDPDVFLAQAQLGAKTRAGEFNYGYDIFGNEINSDGPDGPRHPTYFSAFIQDKFETSDLVINAGVRLDIFDNDDFIFEDPTNPPWDQNEYGLFQDELVEVDASVDISPRVGIAFSATDRTVFHLQYGRFVQAPRQTDIYTGVKRYSDLFTASNSFRTNLVGLGLKPEITTQYEFGFNQQFSDNAAFDVTTFYKSIKDMIQVTSVEADPSSSSADYNVLANLDFATTAGVEFSLNLRRTSRIAGNINYTFSGALGTGSNATTTISGVEGEIEVPTVISPLDFHRSHVGSLNLDYRFGKGDSGKLLQQLGANFLFSFQSGHPFTLSTGTTGGQRSSIGGFISDPRSRFPLEAVNSSTTPLNFQLDVRLDKTVNLDRFRTSFYVYVQNLTNRKNVINVFGRTGNAFNDGFLDNPWLSGSRLARFDRLSPGYGAAAYEALYRAINLGGNAYNYRGGTIDSPEGFSGREVLGVPRQIRVGARVEL